jgi:hypothetical protein
MTPDHTIGASLHHFIRVKTSPSNSTIREATAGQEVLEHEGPTHERAASHYSMQAVGA